MPHSNHPKPRRVPQTLDAHLQKLARRAGVKSCAGFCIAALAGSACVYAPAPLKIVGGVALAIALPLSGIAGINSLAFHRRRLRLLKGEKPGFPFRF